MAEIKLATAHMPLLERLRKAANCVVFLDGAPEPAADVADMLRKSADEIERLRGIASLARPFISDAGSDEDPDANKTACELLEKIDAPVI